MEIQIEKTLTPMMFELSFTEDRKKGETVTMAKRDYRKYVRANRQYHKAQAEMQKLLNKVRY